MPHPPCPELKRGAGLSVPPRRRRGAPAPRRRLAGPPALPGLRGPAHRDGAAAGVLRRGVCLLPPPVRRQPTRAWPFFRWCLSVCLPVWGGVTSMGVSFCNLPSGRGPVRMGACRNGRAAALVLRHPIQAPGCSNRLFLPFLAAVLCEITRSCPQHVLPSLVCLDRTEMQVFVRAQNLLDLQNWRNHSLASSERAKLSGPWVGVALSSCTAIFFGGGVPTISFRQFWAFWTHELRNSKYLEI